MQHVSKVSIKLRSTGLNKKKSRFKDVEVGPSPVKGDSSAALVIEFSDFQCPYCRRFTQYLKKAFDQSHVDHPFSVAFKHFPLSSQCIPILLHLHLVFVRPWLYLCSRTRPILGYA